MRPSFLRRQFKPLPTSVLSYGLELGLGHWTMGCRAKRMAGGAGSAVFESLLTTDLMEMETMAQKILEMSDLF